MVYKHEPQTSDGNWAEDCSSDRKLTSTTSSSGITHTDVNGPLSCRSTRFPANDTMITAAWSSEPPGFDSLLHTHRSGRGSDPSWPVWRSALWHHRRWVSATRSKEETVRTEDAGWNEFDTRRTTYSGNTAPVRQSGLGQALSATHSDTHSYPPLQQYNKHQTTAFRVYCLIKTKHSENKAERTSPRRSGHAEPPPANANANVSCGQRHIWRPVDLSFFLVLERNYTHQYAPPPTITCLQTALSRQEWSRQLI